MGPLLKGALALLIVGSIVTVATVPPVVLSKKSSQESSNSDGTPTTTVTQTTSKLKLYSDIFYYVYMISLLATVTCASGYVQTSSGICVNTQIDFNNCGSIGYVCTSNYISCSAGVCSTRPAVQLPGAIGVPGWTNTLNDVDNATVAVTLPISITLYNITTNNVKTSNGVGFYLFENLCWYCSDNLLCC